MREDFESPPLGIRVRRFVEHLPSSQDGTIPLAVTLNDESAKVRAKCQKGICLCGDVSTFSCRMFVLARNRSVTCQTVRVGSAPDFKRPKARQSESNKEQR